MATADAQLVARLAKLFDEHDAGVPDALLQRQFGSEYERLAQVLNQMLEKRRLTILRAADGSLVYKMVSEEKANKLQGLSREQELIYQEIRKSGNRGIWTRKIKVETGVQQQVLTKTLKLLEQRQLIKSVKSVTSRAKKLYMLFEEVPATEITGGAWYTEGEFDHEFVNGMSQFIHSFIIRLESVTLKSIEDAVRVSGISRVELSRADVQQIVDTLEYDGAIEKIHGFENEIRIDDEGHSYRKSPTMDTPKFVTDTPCGVCPIAAQCCEGGAISSATCIYMQEWLKLNNLDF